MPNFPPYVYPFPFIVAAICIFIASQYALTRHKAQGAWYLFFVCLAASFWSLTEGLLYVGLNQETKVLLTKYQYFGIVPIPPLTLLFVLSVFGIKLHLIRKMQWTFTGIMAMIVALVWTNPFHRQFFTSYAAIETETVQMLALDHGPMWWATIAYHYLLVVVVSLILINKSIKASVFERARARLMLAAVASVWIANAVYISGHSPVPNMDISPIAFTLVAGSMAWSFFRYNLLDIVPAAKQEVFRGMEDAVLVFDESNRIVDYNAAAKTIIITETHADKDKQTQQVFAEFPALQSILESMRRREIPIQVDDLKNIYDARVSALLDNHGKTIGKIVALRDITARKHAIDAILKSEERYKFLAENMGDIVWTLDMNFNVTYVSPSVERVLGFTPEERKKQKLEEMITPESMERVMALYTVELQQDEKQDADPYRTTTIEVEYYNRNGANVWMENQVKAIRDKAGKIIGMYGASRDITRRKIAEEKIKRAKMEWERTFDAVSDPIAILDTEYRIVRTNKAMASKLGLSPKSIAGATCYECVHGKDEPPANCPHKQLMADGREHTEEVFEERIGGDFLVTASPILDSKGVLVGSVHIARDITKQKEIEKERENLIGELQEALANIRTLKGLLPICSACKKIRDDEGYWSQMESYIQDRSEAEFSHGICPDCAKELYPDLDIHK